MDGNQNLQQGGKKSPRDAVACSAVHPPHPQYRPAADIPRLSVTASRWGACYGSNTCVWPCNHFSMYGSQPPCSSCWEQSWMWSGNICERIGTDESAHLFPVDTVYEQTLSCFFYFWRQDNRCGPFLWAQPSHTYYHCTGRVQQENRIQSQLTCIFHMEYLHDGDNTCYPNRKGICVLFPFQ